MSAQNVSAVRWSTWFQWVLASTVGLVVIVVGIGAGIGIVYWGMNNDNWWLIMIIVGLSVAAGIPVGVVVGAVSGALSGSIQRLILRWQITQITRWVLISIVSLTTSLVVGTVVVGTAMWVIVRAISIERTAAVPDYPEATLGAGLVLIIALASGVLCLVIVGVGGGVANRIMQWLILQQQISYRAGWWLLASTTGWAVGLGIGGTVGGTVTGAIGFGWSEIFDIVFAATISVVGTVGLLVTWTVGGTITWITIITLVWLLQRLRDRGLGRIRSQRVRGGKIEVVARDRIN